MTIYSVGRYALVLMSSLLTGVIFFIGSFFVLDILWTHVVVRDPKQVSVGDGVVVVGGGLLIGTTLGLAALVLMLYRFWPRKSQ